MIKSAFTVLKELDFRNRRSSTCGRGLTVEHNFPAFQADDTPLRAPQAAPCGYEDHTSQVSHPNDWLYLIRNTNKNNVRQ